VRRREFWLAQAAHQLPMLAAMALMATVLRSVPGLLLIVAGLWIVALVRARTARTDPRAREFLVDVLAMALVVVVPLLRATAGDGMPGMGSVSLGGAATAGALVVVWAGVRVAMSRTPAARAHRAGSVVSGSCCAVGLVAMLLM
jgi:hypothetical protein